MLHTPFKSFLSYFKNEKSSEKVCGMKKLNVIFIFVGDPLNATAKMDVLKLGVDFNNILRAAFLYKRFWEK